MRFLHDKNPVFVADDDNEENKTTAENKVRYMDKIGRLTDTAVDRITFASAAKAMWDTYNRCLRDPGIPYKKPIGIIRSLVVSNIIATTERHGEGSKRKNRPLDHTEMATLRKKLGLGISAENGGGRDLWGGGTPSVDFYDVVVIPLFSDEHWSVMVCYNGDVDETSAATLHHYDSCNGCHDDLAHKARDALVEIGFLPEGCFVKRTPEYPQQKDMYECGYSVIQLVGVISAAYQTSHAPTSKLTIEEFPSMEEERIKALSAEIMNMLGGSRFGSYPSELNIQEKTPPRSLVTLYNTVRERLLLIEIERQFQPPFPDVPSLYFENTKNKPPLIRNFDEYTHKKQKGKEKVFS
jgi:hypothetical protein